MMSPRLRPRHGRLFLASTSTLLCLLWILSLLPSRAHGDAVTDALAVICDAVTNYTIDSGDPDAVLAIAFGWCVSDPECALLFAQTPVTNFTLFSFMMRRALWGDGAGDPDPAAYFTEWFCGATSLNDLMRRTFLLRLELAERRSQQCPAPMMVQVLADNTTRCVCRPHVVCEQELPPYNLFLWLMIGIFALLSLLICSSCSTAGKVAESWRVLMERRPPVLKS